MKTTDKSKLYTTFKKHEQEFIYAIEQAAIISAKQMGNDVNKIYSKKCDKEESLC
jgi:hypothetical protein